MTQQDGQTYYWNQFTNVTSWTRPSNHAFTRPPPPTIHNEVLEQGARESNDRRRRHEENALQFDVIERAQRNREFTKNEARLREENRCAFSLQFVADIEGFKERKEEEGDYLDKRSADDLFSSAGYRMRWSNNAEGGYSQGYLCNVCSTQGVGYRWFCAQTYEDICEPCRIKRIKEAQPYDSQCARQRMRDLRGLHKRLMRDTHSSSFSHELIRDVFSAVRKADFEKLRTYVNLKKTHIFRSSRTLFGETPLHIAVKDSNPDIVSFLLVNRANPVATDQSAQTPLSLAQDLAERQTTGSRAVVVLNLIRDAYVGTVGTKKSIRAGLLYDWRKMNHAAEVGDLELLKHCIDAGVRFSFQLPESSFKVRSIVCNFRHLKQLQNLKARSVRFSFCCCPTLNRSKSTNNLEI